jgi:hypothetical protein
MHVQPLDLASGADENLDRRRHSATIFIDIGLCGATRGVMQRSPSSVHQADVKVLRGMERECATLGQSHIAWRSLQTSCFALQLLEPGRAGGCVTLVDFSTRIDFISIAVLPPLVSY